MTLTFPDNKQDATTRGSLPQEVDHITKERFLRYDVEIKDGDERAPNIRNYTFPLRVVYETSKQKIRCGQTM